MKCFQKDKDTALSAITFVSTFIVMLKLLMGWGRETIKSKCSVRGTTKGHKLIH